MSANITGALTASGRSGDHYYRPERLRERTPWGKEQEMKSAKPEVALVAGAVDAIQATHKPSNVIPESPTFLSVCAHEPTSK